MKKIILAVLIQMFFINAYAVEAIEGYKSLKFGDSTSDVLSSGFCEFSEPKVGDIFTSYMCTTSFAGHKTSLTAYFADGIFSRVAIRVPKNYENSIARLISDKYGGFVDPHFTLKMAESFASGAIHTFDAIFNNPNVYLRYGRGVVSAQFVFLIYVSKEYIMIRDEKYANAASDDI